MTINLVGILLLWTAALSRVLPPDAERLHLLRYPLSILPAVLGIGFEVLVWLNLFFAVTWLFTHRKLWSFVSLIALAIAFPALRSTWPCLSSSSEAGDSTATLRILSYNTQLLQRNTPIEQNGLLAYVKSSGADLVCMQEYAVYKDHRYPTFEGVKRYLREEYPYTYFDFPLHNSRLQYGLAVYSKYPLIHKQTIPLQTEGNGANYCDVVVTAGGRSDTIRLFTNHLQSNVLQPTEIDSLFSLPTIINAAKNAPSRADVLPEGRGRVIKTSGKLRRAYAKRTTQVEQVRSAIEASPYPVIVCGDFNDVPVSYTYRHLSRGLKDAFLTASDSPAFSTGHTFVRKGLGIRIDYILTSPTLHASDFRIDRVTYSDHYPVSCTLSW